MGLSSRIDNGDYRCSGESVKQLTVGELIDKLKNIDPSSTVSIGVHCENMKRDFTMIWGDLTYVEDTREGDVHLVNRW